MAQFRSSDQPVAPKQITGVDGKKYTPPTRKPEPPRRREANTKEMDRIGEEFRKVTNRLMKLADDDRFDLDLNGHLKNEVRRVHELADHLLDGREEIKRPVVPEPTKSRGNRRKHAQILEAVSNQLAGMCIALDDITELDDSVTAENVGALSDELDDAIESIERVSHLLGLNRLRGQIEVTP